MLWIANCAAVFAKNREYLNELDAAIDDGDHGANMDRGFKAVMYHMPKDVRGVGKVLLATLGGNGSPLFGTFFYELGDEFDLERATESVMKRSGAKLGDKSLIDALIPAVEAYKNGQPYEKAAKQGMLDTIPMVAKVGKSRSLGESSVGHQDPGATSAYLILQTAADTWN